MKQPRPASGILPLRVGSDGKLQVLMVLRSRRGGFFPGFWAFPGGAQEASDPDPVACGLRELFEETGLWPATPAPDAAERAELLAGRLSITTLLERYPVSAPLPAGVRTTPDYSGPRFHAQFFAALIPEGQIAEAQPQELEQVRWWDPSEARGAWERSEIFLAAPTQLSIQFLCQYPDWREAAVALQAVGPVASFPISVCPGLCYVPLETPTLPPARHTIAYLTGGERLLVVDPGSLHSELLDAPIANLALPVEAVLFTHHHPDHIGGQQWARDRGYPIWAAAETSTHLAQPADRILADGEILALGGGWDWTVLHTPGHAAGHLALWNPERAILLAADLVSGLSTILVIPGEGTMGEYLASLERCMRLDPHLVLPAHGGPYGPGSDLLGKTHRHRLEREARVLASLTAEPQTIEEVFAVAYADCPPGAEMVGKLSLQSHLNKLVEDGLARLTDAGWSQEQTQC